MEFVDKFKGYLRNIRKVSENVLPKLEDNHNQIRLLHLLPTKRPGTKNPPRSVVCKFSVVSLDHPPYFEALSYVWGDPSAAVNIKVNGLSFPVTQNLYTALRYLCRDDRERVIWVDAVCIDQSDIFERSHQVGKMGDIYRKAGQVIAFLGTPTDRVDLAMDYLAAAAKNQHFDPRLTPHTTARGMDANSQELCDSIMEFFDLPWWKRIWTVQEFAVAREVIFQCGTHTLAGELVTLACDNLKHHDYTCCSGNETRFSNYFSARNISVWHALDKIGTMTELLGSGLTFIRIIGMFRWRDCRDPRDKVFGMLSLANQEEADSVKIDYTRTAEEVFQDFTIATIQRSGNLEVLHYLTGHRELAKLASFVPDWTVLGEEKDFVKIARRSYWQLLLFKASGNSLPEWSPVGTGKFRTNGLIVGKVSAVGAWPLILSSWLRERRSLAVVDDSQLLVSDLDLGKEEQAVVLPALCGGMILDREDKDTAWFRRVEYSRDEEKLVDWWAHKFDDLRTTLEANVEDVELAYQATSCQRDFILTEEGYMGFAIKGCEKGDRIAALGGGDVLYILRPVPGTEFYTLVGDANINGLMKGEALGQLGRGVDEFDELILV